jgi:hypothetical protein
MKEVPHAPASSGPGQAISSPSPTGGWRKTWPQQQTHHRLAGADEVMAPGSRLKRRPASGMSCVAPHDRPRRSFGAGWLPCQCGARRRPRRGWLRQVRTSLGRTIRARSTRGTDKMAPWSLRSSTVHSAPPSSVTEARLTRPPASSQISTGTSAIVPAGSARAAAAVAQDGRRRPGRSARSGDRQDFDPPGPGWPPADPVATTATQPADPRHRRTSSTTDPR